MKQRIASRRSCVGAFSDARSPWTSRAGTIGGNVREMSASDLSKPQLPRMLNVLDASAIVIGIVIGSGIFLLPNVIARALPSAPAILAVWIVSGVLSFFGALAYAELGAM